MKIKSIIKNVTRCFSLTLTPLALAVSQAYAQTAPTPSSLLSADSTRITPRLGAVPAPTPTAPPTTFGNNSMSVPLRTAHSCSSYRGQYDIDNQAVGTFYITRENNPYLPNYGQILSTDNSGCYQPCSTRNQTSTRSCSSVYGSGWTGSITYNTYYSCTAGGYQQAQSPTYVSDTCVAPPPPPPPPPACSSTYTTRTGSCTSRYGSGWSGTVYYITYYTCNSSGTRVQQPESYLTDDCRYTPAPTPAPTVPVPVPVTPTPVTPVPVTPAPVVPVPVPVTPVPVIPVPVPVTPAPVIPVPVPVTPAPVIPVPVPVPDPVPVPVPPPAGCETTMGYVSYGAVRTACIIWGYAGVYPSGENYRCTVNGWALNNPGNSQYMNYCE